MARLDNRLDRHARNIWPMPAVLRDNEVFMPACIDAKVVLAFCSVVVAVTGLWWNWRRSRKGLAFSVSSSPVLQNTKGLNGAVVISYNSGDGTQHQVQDVYTARLTVRNSGTQEITKLDFDSPLKSTVPKPIRILSVAVGPCKPEILANHADYSLSAQETLTLNPTLLNPKDSISFSLVLSGVQTPARLSENIVCDTRIKGIHQIERINEDVDLAARLATTRQLLSLVQSVLAVVLMIFILLNGKEVFNVIESLSRSLFFPR